MNSKEETYNAGQENKKNRFLGKWLKSNNCHLQKSNKVLVTTCGAIIMISIMSISIGCRATKMIKYEKTVRIEYNKKVYNCK